MEQNDFLRKKGIFQMRQFMVMGVNGIVFLTQFFALKRMTEVGMPGISTEGVLWFTDLSACDPYYVLPTLSAITLCLALKVDIFRIRQYICLTIYFKQYICRLA
jgi:YidC/Oxa1 family membrane protein insertase